jgi:hypothetical protein
MDSNEYVGKYTSLAAASTGKAHTNNYDAYYTELKYSTKTTYFTIQKIMQTILM